ncbi:MAG: FAD-dependent oxidoreductase [Gemmatimonadetes bacterium]|nr:FAD-dependent oxidoreductase [Gemmatimonadota bacterium]
MVGGGFAGLYTARGLADAPVRITVVDRENHHLFQPMLYQVATAALASSNIASPIRSILSRQPNAEVLMGEVASVQPDARTITLVDGSTLNYDYLILATGARHSYFGHDEWEILAPGLKSLEDAEEIRRRILLSFERAERESDPVKRHAHLTFVVIGGGPTGVEVAGALAEIRRHALRRDFRHIDPREATVMLIEGGPRILSSYPAELAERAKYELRRLGVEVREQTMVTEIRQGLIQASGWTIPTQTVVWAAGNVASPIMHSLGTPLDRAGRAIVSRLQRARTPELFVLGDAAAVSDGKGGTLPGICPVAIQMGQYTARTIAGDLAGRPRRPFSYWDKGQLAVIGRGHAVADIWKLHFGGFLAWLIWAFVHIFFLIGFRNRVLVMLQWGWSYFTYERGARLITWPWAVAPANRPAAGQAPSAASPAEPASIACPNLPRFRPPDAVGRRCRAGPDPHDRPGSPTPERRPQGPRRRAPGSSPAASPPSIRCPTPTS